MKYTILLALFFLTQSVIGQDFVVPKSVQATLNDSTKTKILEALDLLFEQINEGKITNEYIVDEHRDLTISILSGLNGMENKDTILNYFKKQLINLFRISEKQYTISIAYLGSGSDDDASEIKAVFNLIALKEDGSIKFSLPLNHMTRDWKSQKIGRINYFFKDKLNTSRANTFNTKNEVISKKLEVPTEDFDFFICENYQEIIELLGYAYDSESIGQVRDGYGVDNGYIFSIMKNEDFSHDIFHYYSGKINKRINRNWITEEGLAYSWGNAYYTDKNGEMVENRQLVKALKKYIQENEQVNLMCLFESNAKIFGHIAPEISVRSVMSGLICDYIEQEKGIDGILAIINCGRKPSSLDNYFKTTNELIGLNRKNFNRKVVRLLE